MKLLTIAFIVMASLNGHAECEIEMTNLSRSFVGLVKASIAKTELSDSEVREFVFGNGPLPRKTRGIGNLDLQRRSDLLYRRMSDVERKQAREALMQIMQIKAQGDQQISVARKSQKHVVDLREIYPLNSAVPLGSARVGWIQSVHDGRPIFFGQFASRSGKDTILKTVKMDPLHSDANERVKVILEAKNPNEGRSTSAAVLTLNERTYYAHFEQKILWDIAAEKEVSYSEIKNPPTGDISGMNMFVKTPHGTKLISTNSAGIGPKEFDLDQPQASARNLGEMHGDDLEVLNVDGENIVTWRGGREIFLYYVDRVNAEPFVAVKVSEGHPYNPVVFRELGKDILIFSNARWKSPGGSREGVYDMIKVDLDSKEQMPLILDADSISKPHFYSVGSVPKILVETHRGYESIDPHSGKSDFQNQLGVKRSTIEKKVTWKGNDYLIWMNADKSIGLLDMTSQSYARSKPLTGSGITIYPFEFNGMPYAMVETDRGLPSIIQLISDSTLGESAR